VNLHDDDACDHPDHGHRAASDQRPSRPHDLAEPAEDRRADRRATHQDHDVERHHAPAQPRIDAKLNRGVACGHGEQCDQAHERQTCCVHRVAGRQPSGELDQAERDGHTDHEAGARSSAAPSGDQGTGQRADSQERPENAIRLSAPMEFLLRHQSGGHLEVQSECADEEHHAQHEQNVRATADVCQTLAKLPLGPWTGRDRVKHPAIDDQQGDDEGRIAERVGQNCPARSDLGDHEPCERRANYPRGVEGGRVEADRVREMIRTSNLGHEALSRRIVECGAQSERERNQIDLLGRRNPSHSQDAERCRAQRQPALGDLENLPLVEAVGNHSCVRGQQQHWQELQACSDADRESRAAGELQHQPVLRHPLHPGPDVGNEGPGEIDAVIASGQCGEHAAAPPSRGWRSSGSAISLFRGRLDVDSHP